MDFAQAKQERDPNVQYVGEDEHPHEKKSVLKKVKAKAKKIKDTIAKKVHHDHDDGSSDSSSDSSSEDYDDETVENPEIHGAPIYDSSTTRSSVFGAAPPADLSPPGPAYKDPHKTDLGNLDGEKHNVGFLESAVMAGGLLATHDDLPTSIPHYTALPATTALPAQVIERETNINVHKPRGLQESDHDKMILDRKTHDAPKVHDSTTVRSSAFDAPLSRPEDLAPPGVPYKDLHQRKIDTEKTDLKHNEKRGVNFGDSTMGEGLNAKHDIPDQRNFDTGKLDYNEKRGVNFRGEGLNATHDIPDAIPHHYTRPAPTSSPGQAEYAPPMGAGFRAPQNSPHRPADTAATFVHVEMENPGQPKVNLDFPKMLEEDPAAPKHALDANNPPTTNYQTKVTDTSGKGGEVAEMGPILHSLDKMKIHDERERDTGRNQNLPSETRISSSTQPFPTGGSHDQFCSESRDFSAGSHDQFSQKPTFDERKQNLASGTRISSSTQPFSTGSHDQFSSGNRDFSSNLPFSTESQVHFSPAPNFQDSKQHLPSETHNASSKSNIPFLDASRERSRFSPEPMAPEDYIPENQESGFTNLPDTMDIGIRKPSNQGGGITGAISSATSAIADKAVSAKNIVASKIGYGENKSEGEQFETQNPSNQSSYTDKISSATSAIADKAAAAKDAVASKIGYGENQSPTNENQGGGITDKISSATSAIADKAAAAKNTVASKIGYGEETSPRNEGNQNQGGYISSATSAIADKAVSAKNTVVSTVSGAGSAVMSKIPGVGSGSAKEETGQNKGGSVKEYFVEKLRPGEEDKALSDVISGALHVTKGKGEVSEEESRPRGKVKESVEVRRRLGPFNEKDEERVRHGMENTPGTGLTDKLCGAVTSWFGKDEEAEKVQQGNEGFSSSTNEDAGTRTNMSGERRLQEN